MLDLDIDVVDACWRALRDSYPRIVVTSEELRGTATFPTVFIWEIQNEVNRNTLDSSQDEIHSRIGYEAQVYSDKVTGGRAEVRDIVSRMDKAMSELGFVRIMSNPLPNQADGAITRHIARWRALVSQDKVTYRR